MSKIYLYTPIRPLETGTADYFDIIVRQLACRTVDRSSIVIVVDDNEKLAAQLTKDYYGFEVRNYRQIPDVLFGDETRIYFLANNEYHTFCYDSLSRIKTSNRGKIITVIHEPSCFMLFNNICSNEKYTFTLADLYKNAYAQFGNHANFFVDARKTDSLPFETEFFMHCQHLALSKSNEIWTHSAFSAFKLFTESHARPSGNFVIAQHPKKVAPIPPSVRSASHLERTRKHRIGLFGWVSPSKRVNQAIKAYAMSLQTLDSRESKDSEMIIVGKLPGREYYDPKGLVQSLGIEDNVKFFDYPTLDEFETLIESCTVILNLRFPSCGETSGTLERAVAAGVPVISTAYQAFWELPASAYVSPFGPTELVQLFSVLTRILHGTLNLAPPAPMVERNGIAELICGLLGGGTNVA